MPSLTINQLLSHLQGLQQKGQSPYFVEGMFASFRENKLWGTYRRPDNNIFGTASVGFILQDILPDLDSRDAHQAACILQKIRPVLEAYQNKDGLLTYNFWQTRPSQHFPFGRFFRRFKHFKLPDDIDDTSLIYNLLPSERLSISWLKEKLKQHTGTVEPAPYSTWFGKTMPSEQDACALSNLMYLLLKSGETLNAYDQATLHWLFEQVRSGRFVTHPFAVARHYASPPLIAYHYARWLPLLSHTPGREADVPMALSELENYLRMAKPNNKIDLILLDTTARKLGFSACFISEDKLENWQADIPRFYSFIGAFLAPYSGYRLARWLAPWPLARLNWHCEAHCWALALENAVWRKKTM